MLSKTVLTLSVGVLAASVAASPVVTITLADSTETSIAVNPAVDPFFTLAVRISAPELITSAEMGLQIDRSSAISLIGGAYGQDWVSDPLFVLDLPTESSIQTLNPTSELFGSVPTVISGISGDTIMATLDVQVLGSAPLGTWSINAYDLVIGDAGFKQDAGASTGQDFRLTILPEPATLLMLIGGAVLIFHHRQQPR